MKNISAPFVLRELNTIGYKEAPDEPARAFAQWSFLYLISGEVLTYTGGESILCGSHNILLVPPGTEFRVRWYKDSIGYTGGFEEASLKDRSLPLLRLTSPRKVRISYSDEIFADELMAALSRHLSVPEIAASCIDLLLSLLQPAEETGSTISRVFLDDIFSGAPVCGGPQLYAGRQGIREADLNRVLKEETGRTAGDWIAVARISLAKRYLRDPSLSMAEVSERVGLDDQSYFARFFRKLEGVTPSEFRKDIFKKS
ncbi:MAG: helix-turn-helix transcriptional regulator [Bacteroidales bacterium]|nr:helix-turn-helix transcriptional regulator [Bacteroidales bacterium]